MKERLAQHFNKSVQCLNSRSKAKAVFLSVKRRFFLQIPSPNRDRVGFVRPAGDTLRLASAQGIDKDRFENRTLRMGDGVAGRVAAERRFMAVENVLGDPLFKEKKMAKRLSIVSMLSVPMLIHENEVAGVMDFFTCKPRRFTEAEALSLSSVANGAATAVRSADRMVRVRVVEEELKNLRKIEEAKTIVMRRKSLADDASAFHRFPRRPAAFRLNGSGEEIRKRVG